jgi:hypothetical protein
MRLSCRSLRWCLLAAWLAGALSVWAGVKVEGDDGKPGPAIAVPAPAAGPAAAPADPFGSVLVFQNGDRLHGQLAGIPGDGTLLWRRPDSPQPIPFRLDALYGIKLVHPQPAPMATGTRLTLTNGDALLGEVRALDQQHLQLATAYGGELALLRPMVAALHPADAPDRSYVYEGPGDLRTWTISQGDWVVRRGVLTGFGRIGTDAKLPGNCRLAFEIRWPGRYTNFTLALFCEDLRNFQFDAYHLAFGSSAVALHRRSRNQSLNLGQVELPAFANRTKARLELLINRDESKFALLVNGDLVKEWTDPQGWAAKGTGLVFSAHDQSARIGLANLTVANWDGKLGATGPLVAGAQDTVQFTNFDRITGDALGIADGQLAFKTPYATLQIPLARIETATLRRDLAQRARRYAEDVELYFPNGDRCTVRLKSLAGTQLVGYSENFGEVKLDLAAFTGLRFNLYADIVPVEDVGGLFEDTTFEDFVFE